MRIFLITLSLFLASPVFAQDTLGSAPQPTSQDIENQIAEVGCKAERQASARTIIQLRDQISQLQKQIDKLSKRK